MVFAMLLLASCAPAKKPPGGIEITQVEAAIGRVNGGGNLPVVSYNVTLRNASQTEVTVRWMEPFLNDNIS